MPEPTPTAPATTTGEELAERLPGFVLSQAIYVAAVLGIADRLADGLRSATALAVAAGADPDGLYRLLRLLAGHGIFVELPGGRFANSTHSELLREGPGSLRALAVAVGEGAYPALGATRQMIQTGEPAFQVVFGAVWEEQLARDWAASRRFNRFVAARKQALAEVLAEGRWRGSETVVDVAGGDGALVVGLLERCPDLRGIVFDLPQPVAEAAERIEAAGLAGRCQTVAGSFFGGIPAGGDVYVRSYVLHGWDDAHASEILGQVRRVIPDHGRLLVVEEVLAQPNQPGGKVLDLLMAAVGGRERTEPEWRALLADGGFALVGIRPAIAAASSSGAWLSRSPAATACRSVDGPLAGWANRPWRSTIRRAMLQKPEDAARHSPGPRRSECPMLYGRREERARIAGLLEGARIGSA